VCLGPRSENQLAGLLHKSHENSNTAKDAAELATAVAVFRAIGLLRHANPSPEEKVPGEEAASPLDTGVGEAGGQGAAVAVHSSPAAVVGAGATTGAAGSTAGSTQEGTGLAAGA
jgi:hypothetical protein